jgi:hypothetical protein
VFVKIWALIKIIPGLWKAIERLGAVVQTAVAAYKRRKRRKEIKEAVEDAKKTKSTKKLENLFRNDD